MLGISWLRMFFVVLLVSSIAMLEVGCKKDDSPTGGGGGGGGVTTLSFSTSGQTLTVPSGGGAVKAKLTGGTLPYTISSAPSASVATASFSNDTLTVTPVAAGTTSITIADASLTTTDSPPLTVTIGITVSTSGGGGGSGSFVINGAGYSNVNVNITSAAGGLYSGGTGPETAAGGYGLAGSDTVTFEIYFPGSATGAHPWNDSSGFSFQIRSGTSVKTFISRDGGGSTIIDTYGSVGGNITGTMAGRMFGGVFPSFTDSLTVSSGSFTAIRTQ